MRFASSASAAVYKLDGFELDITGDFAVKNGSFVTSFSEEKGALQNSASWIVNGVTQTYSVDSGLYHSTATSTFDFAPKSIELLPSPSSNMQMSAGYFAYTIKAKEGRQLVSTQSMSAIGQNRTFDNQEENGNKTSATKRIIIN